MSRAPWASSAAFSASRRRPMAQAAASYAPSRQKDVWCRVLLCKKHTVVSCDATRCWSYMSIRLLSREPGRATGDASQAAALLERHAGVARAPRQRVGHLDAFGAARQRRAGVHVHLKARRRVSASLAASLASHLHAATTATACGVGYRGHAPPSRRALMSSQPPVAAWFPPGRRRAHAAPPWRAASAGRRATPASRRTNPTCAPHPATSARRVAAARHPSPPSECQAAKRRRYGPSFSATAAREGPRERAPQAARP